MKKSQSFHYGNEDDLLNEIIKNERKVKVTDIICSLINYFSLIPSIIYNTAWFFYLKSILEEMNENDISVCNAIFNWTNYATSLCIFPTIKALILLFCIKICVGEENDCNIFCFIVKMLTSFVPSILFVILIPNNINNYRIHLGDIEVKECDKMSRTLNTFYKLEYAYMITILVLFCLIPFGAIATGFKEYWKSRGYNKGE
jgi:hypothetical protein